MMSLADLPLTPTERRLLDALAARQGRVVSKEALLHEVWGLPADSPSRTLYSTMERLRRKVEDDPKRPRHLLTIGREGYAFVASPEPSEGRPSEAPSRPAASAPAEEPPPRRLVVAVRSGVGSGLIVVLHGPAGVGKTTLAREALPEARLVDLTHATDRQAVLQAVAAALSLPLRDADDPRELERLARVAAHAPGLVLDAAEGAVEVVAALLATWPATLPPLLVTSQVDLPLPGAMRVSVPPLGPSEALALFLAHARQRRPGWAPTPAEEEVLGEVVALLDGLPLALELAARWSQLVSPAELLSRLQAGRLPLVAEDAAAGPARHSSLDAALQGSYDALTPPLRRALFALAYADGGVAVADLERLLGPEALLWVDALAARSLVRSDQVRVRVLGTVGRFVLRHLAGDPVELARVQRVHGHCYAHYGQPEVRRRPRLDGPRGLLALAPELGNLALAVAHGLPDDAAAAASAWADIRRGLGSHRGVAEVLQGVSERAIPSAHLRARVWMELGIARRYGGDPDGAFGAFDEAARWVSTPAQEAELAKLRGTAQLYHGDLSEAEATLRRAAAGFEALGDVYNQGLVYGDLSTAVHRLGRVDEAAEVLHDALRCLRSAGARFAESVYLGNLGVLLMKQGRFASARAHYQQALALHRELGSARFEVMTRSNLGLLAAMEGRAADAEAQYLAVIELGERGGDRRDVAIARVNLAWTYLGGGRLVSARRSLDLAADEVEALRLPYVQVDAALTRSWLCRAEGDLAAAGDALGVAAALVEAHGFAEHRPSVTAQRGLLAAARGAEEDARAALAQAREEAAAFAPGHGWDGAVYIDQLAALLAPAAAG